MGKELDEPKGQIQVVRDGGAVGLEIEFFDPERQETVWFDLKGLNKLIDDMCRATNDAFRHLREESNDE